MIEKLKKHYKKIALVLSLCAIFAWAVLGTGASLAWFSDSTEDVRNIFHIAKFDLEVSYKGENGKYKTIEGSTEIFDDQALFEPGYVQVVYLKIENRGEVAFDFQTAVNITGYTTGINYFGVEFQLAEYLMFGFVTADTEAELNQLLLNREAAKGYATYPMNNYASEVAELSAGGERYAALIVYMPESVANDANYRGATQPTVELGIIVNATQKTQ